MDGTLISEIIANWGPLGIMGLFMILFVNKIVPAFTIFGTMMQTAMQDQRIYHKLQMDELQSRIKELETDRDEMEERLKEMEKSSEDNLAQIIKLNEQLRASEKAQRAALDELHKLRDELDKVKEERDALAKERDALKEQVDRLEKHVEKLQTQMNGKQDEAKEKKPEAEAGKP